MIVRCAKCETRFKLDETRLPARGARVRCSRCKHAFFVTPPQADREAVVQGLADEATQGRARAPEPAWDLDGPEPARSAGGAKARGRAEGEPELTKDRTARSAAPRGEGDKRARGERSQPERAPTLSAPEADDDSDWTFEDEVPGLAGDASSLDLQDSDAEAAPLGGDPNESSFAGLGDPESWDLLTQPAAPPPTARATQPALPVRRAPEPESAEEVARSAPAAKPAPAEVTVAAPVEATPKAVVSWPGLAGVAALAIALVWGSVHASAHAETVATLAPVAGLEVASAQARWIENAQVGPILVVSGELRNPGPAARSFGSGLVVSLLDEAGAPIDEPEAVAAAPLGEERLREGDPHLLRSDQQRASGDWAARELAVGAVLAFEAVFERFPAGARRFDLAAKPLAVAPREALTAAPAPPSAVAPAEPARGTEP